ncbi:MAG: DUF1501 domain-containing protein [Isosphaeraceae bacterium]|nr:DUF1501 domain-containing protein [Isosphaeraceae bacterium]
MNRIIEPLSRRTLLQSVSSGFGYLAFAGMSTIAAADDAPKTESPLAPKAPHFPAKAKRVIFLCMHGAPSHVDTFDYKPRLTADSGNPSPVGRLGGARLLGSLWKFKQHGQSGQWISDLFPEVAAHADRLCIVRGMHTDLPAHPQAYLMMHTGSSQFVRPSLGAWTLYGLGTDNQSLPGFVALKPLTRNGGPQNSGAAFLPAIYQGTRIGAENTPIENARLGNITNPGKNPAAQRRRLDFVQELNRDLLDRDKVHPGVEGIIESYELAFRMQGTLPDLMDLDGESAATKALYGIDDEATSDFGRQCLLARRLTEAGVRFVELSHGDWDQHRNLQADHERHARAVDKPIAGLLTDLAARGLLDETLVIWGGEFGRTPHAQNGDGRDHNNKGYAIWMAGGGVKPGITYGETDDYGYEAVIDKVHVHDWHATILHLLGLDHKRLTYRYAGREMRLTDVKGKVVKAICS